MDPRMAREILQARSNFDHERQRDTRAADELDASFERGLPDYHGRAARNYL
jgi:hypothetical protein